MAEDDLINLKHSVDRHEDAVTKDAQDIAKLKSDVLELLTLVDLLAGFVVIQPFGRQVEEDAKEFRKRLGDLLDKHHIPKRQP